jgi:hypothetical protein
MKAYGGVHVQIHIFLALALARAEWPASRPAALTPGKGSPIPIGQEVGWTTDPV